MEISNLKVRQAFDAWFAKSCVDLFDTLDHLVFYGKHEIEQIAYLRVFLAENGIYVMTGANLAMHNKFFNQVYNAKEEKIITLPKNYGHPGDCEKDGIEYGLGILAERIAA